MDTTLAKTVLNTIEDEMNDFEDDLFDDGVIVSAADVPCPAPPSDDGKNINVVGRNYEDEDTGLDPWASLTARGDGLEEPGQRPITPPEEYDRENATVAPDGSPLTPLQMQKPHLWRAGDPKQPNSGPKKRKANRINVREMVERLTNETMLSPIEVLFHIMNANEESRFHLGLRKSDRISPNLRAKCAQELLAYMAPKLKSVEVKQEGSGESGPQVQIFLPANTREQGSIADKPKIALPEKDGVTIPFSPEIAAQLVLSEEQDDDDDDQDFEDGED